MICVEKSCEREAKEDRRRCQPCIARLKANQARWKAKNREQYLAIGRRYRKKNAERITAKKRTFFAKHPDYQKIATAKWRAKNPGHAHVHKLRQYGLEPEEYDAMLETQNGRCAICGVPASELRRMLAVDHDHITGQNRGLLCSNKCNRAIGLLGDTVDGLMRAVVYLERYETLTKGIAA